MIDPLPRVYTYNRPTEPPGPLHIALIMGGIGIGIILAIVFRLA